MDRWKMVNYQVKEFINFQMAQFMKEISIIINSMGEEN